MQVHAVPVPHVVARFENGNQAVRTFRYVNGRSYRLVTTCSPAEWPKLREDFLAAAARLEVLKPAPWPDLALKGRDNVIQGGVRFSFARGVSKAERAEIMACVAAMQATYTKQHTPLPWSEKDPFLLAVNLTAEDHAEFLDGSSGGEVITLTPRRGLLSTPIGPRGTTHREFFVGSLLLSMLDEHYPGFPRPAHEWLVRGEVSEARMRDTTKKPLPYVTRKFLDSNPTSKRFEEVLPQFAEPGFWGESHAYIALFRAGPEKYQQAYRAFLTEVRRTGDLAKAKQTHLLSLDQEELRSALEKFVKSTLRRAPAVRKKRSGRRR
jgi:hypothetical protein